MLYSGPDAAATLFGEIPSGAILQVLGPPQARTRILNPMNNGVAWIDLGATSPTATPSTEEIAQLAGFEPWWAMTHRPSPAWSSEGRDATSFGDIPMWRYLRVITPPYGNRVLTTNPRNNAQAFVNVTDIGPVGEPPEDYFSIAPPDDEVVGLPARIARETDWFERPQAEDHFSSERFPVNTSIYVEAVVYDPLGTAWYRFGQDQYVPAAAVRTPPVPARTFPGRWIDATLTEPVIVTAYEGDKAVYSALAVKGRTAFETPTGVFHILRRVENEIMDSLTLGIPRESKDGYYLKDVLFTQYFLNDGSALHYNYWRSDWGQAASHGCLGMNYADSLFFWEFATIGTPVSIHE